MTTTPYMPAQPRPRKGVLLLFLQMPLAAVVGGYLIDVVSLPVASFAVFVSSAAFPAWVSHRTAGSEDPREPVHHLHRYVMLALALVTVCTVAVAAASAVTGVGSSGLWRRLGADLTGEPSHGSWALLAGVVVCTLVATCTVVSAQVLFGGGLGLGGGARRLGLYQLRRLRLAFDIDASRAPVASTREPSGAAGGRWDREAEVVDRPTRAAGAHG